ncbi:MAG: hypothetical protein ACI4DO_09865 [Roseburia sp.]
MFKTEDAQVGLSEFFAAYEKYVACMKAQNRRPISMLAYLVEMCQ